MQVVIFKSWGHEQARACIWLLGAGTHKHVEDHKRDNVGWILFTLVENMAKNNRSRFPITVLLTTMLCSP